MPIKRISAKELQIGDLIVIDYSKRGNPITKKVEQIDRPMPGGWSCAGTHVNRSECYHTHLPLVEVLVP